MLTRLVVGERQALQVLPQFRELASGLFVLCFKGIIPPCRIALFKGGETCLFQCYRIEFSRITSYNVCYTKLLRISEAAAAACAGLAPARCEIASEPNAEAMLEAMERLLGAGEAG